MTERTHILILAGTFEARLLAKAACAAFPDVTVVLSFAGVVSDLPDTGVPTRIGGFGGADGLARYLKNHETRILIDATHPFASQMSWNAYHAAKQADVALMRLDRPPWAPGPEDNWTFVPDMASAAAGLDTGSRVFLAVGRKEISTFLDRIDLFALTRMIEPPADPLPDHWRLELARPAQSMEAERALLTTHRIERIVCKNSGGTRSFAKLAAARALGVPVTMIERPALPRVLAAETPEHILRQLAHYL
ncbi:precorrin-6A reductase [Roseibium aquae]|uniref:Precorrin-6A reductase n=1 Tax=Roseibium aquae TaxID=1323746 RepID=A0A916X0U9_9HYPH|nr:cobalt-precorrin-6A reductase [Roseibium aquae]GGB48371.1 precorrin-6A reductase [Roseibium aquae]